MSPGTMQCERLGETANARFMKMVEMRMCDQNQVNFRQIWILIPAWRNVLKGRSSGKIGWIRTLRSVNCARKRRMTNPSQRNLAGIMRGPEIVRDWPVRLMNQVFQTIFVENVRD